MQSCINKGDYFFFIIIIIIIIIIISIANKENIVDQGTKGHTPPHLKKLVESSTTTSFYPSAKGLAEIQLDSPSKHFFACCCKQGYSLHERFYLPKHMMLEVYPGPD